MTDSIRFYAACLASYNSGVLHGAWIDASDDVDTMQEAVDAMLQASPFPNVTRSEFACPACGRDRIVTATARGVAPTCEAVWAHSSGEDCAMETVRTFRSAEEWAVHDYDGLPSSLGEYPGLQAIADYFEIVEIGEARGLESDVVAAVVSNFNGSLSEAKDAIEDHYQGAHDSLAEYAESFADDTGMLADVPDTIARYFDFQAFGRDMELGGDVYTIRVDGSLHVFTSN